jgi:hypothetical protein
MAQDTTAQKGLPSASIKVPIHIGYYSNINGGTITKQGYSYKYRTYKLPSGFVMTGMIELYNAANIYPDTEWDRKVGTMTEAEAMGNQPWSYYLSYRSQSLDQLRMIVAGCFTDQQKIDLRGQTMIVRALVDPDTGKVADVYFIFGIKKPFNNIPVETYRKVELALKEKLTITATSKGQLFNYMEFIWEQEF